MKHSTVANAGVSGPTDQLASQYTPGPWTVELVKGSYQRPALIRAGAKIVASCLGDQLNPEGTSIGVAAANARLIALAPEMLDALQWMVDQDPNHINAFANMARKVLVKL